MKGGEPMLQPTGSVYLDTPDRPRRRPPVPRVSRARSILAGGCVIIGLAALSLAAAIAGLRLLVLDPSPILTAFETTLDDPGARTDLEKQVAAAIENGLVGEELTTIAAAFDLDVNDEARRIAPFVLDDPTVRDELRTLITDLHSRIVIDADPSAIDLGPLTTAVLAVIERESPRLATIIPVDSVLWTVDADSLPDLTGAAALFDRLILLTLVPVLLLAIGALLHPRHHKVIGWIGRWALVFGLVCALAAIGLPYLGSRLTGWYSVEVAIRATSLRLLAPAGMAGIVGMGFVSLAAVAHRREKRKVIDEGAAIALGYDEPPVWQQPPSPTLDLSSRGLVDANHPLTNI
jgi:hypothetical protein